MNRIIIIGNGFDLAHGLKTSYKDFIEWIKLEIPKNSDEYFEHILTPGIDFESGTDKQKASYFFKRYYNKQYNLDNFISYYERCQFVYKNKFLEHILKIQNLKGWTDIEEEYFKKLNECFQIYVKSNHNNITYLTKLEQDFNQIKDSLEEYLYIESKKSIEIKEHLKTSIINPFSQKDNVSSMSTKLKRILFLNFNYTSLEKYYEIPFDNSIKKPYTQIIHIHGELKNKENPIIFGYGNENTEKYKEIEKINCNDFLRNIKSVKYSNTSNYKKLNDFVESNSYQIYIWGHSCENSDGTLLKELFENKNCVSIKPFYYVKKDNSDDYEDKSINISRHFSDKTVYRKRIVNKEYCEGLG